MKNKHMVALAGVAQCLERGPANQRVASSIPGQGMSLGWGPGPQEGACEGKHINVPFPLFLPPWPSPFPSL